MQNNYDLFARRWAWLFPLTYIFHMLEENGCGFSKWMEIYVTGVKGAESRFLALDLFFLSGMIVGTCVAIRFPAWRWLGIMFAVAVITNPLLHLIGSAVTRAYSPGMVTGSLFWLPLGGYALFQAYKNGKTSRFALGMTTGVIASVIITGAFIIAGSFPVR